MDGKDGLLALQDQVLALAAELDELRRRAEALRVRFESEPHTPELDAEDQAICREMADSLQRSRMFYLSLPQGMWDLLVAQIREKMPERVPEFSEMVGLSPDEAAQ